MFRKLSLVLILAALMLVSASELYACVESGFGNQIIRATTTQVRVSGYQTFGTVASGDSCACGLAAGGVVTGVTGVKIVVPGTSTAIAGFGTFNSNANATSAFQTFSPAPGGTNWQALRAVTTGAIPSGTHVEILYDITVSGGATEADVMNSLAANRIGTGQTQNNDNEFVPGHVQVKTALVSSNTVPSLTAYGLIALALLLAGTAVWMFRKRRVSVT
ncbi:MAG: IPTL-CTERM sorting domain-containing protein [candidate division Zixibacteria bacterium]|nr:IPTL-CTERM sorting domain-containing protein [candidate division Zixibacteria bacterium]